MRGPARPPDTVGLPKYVWHTSWQSLRPFGAKKLTLGATPHEWGFAKNDETMLVTVLAAEY